MTVRAFAREVLRGAAITLFHIVTLDGCGRWGWAYDVCYWLETGFWGITRIPACGGTEC